MGNMLLLIRPYTHFGESHTSGKDKAKKEPMKILCKGGTNGASRRKTEAGNSLSKRGKTDKSAPGGSSNGELYDNDDGRYWQGNFLASMCFGGRTKYRLIICRIKDTDQIEVIPFTR